jgi:hypothetical protein
VPFLLAPSERDRATVPLPASLRWTDPGLRAIRLSPPHLRKHRQARHDGDDPADRNPPRRRLRPQGDGRCRRSPNR